MTAGPVTTATGLRLEPARFGTWLFLVSEAMFFAGLIAAFLVLREGSSRFGGDGGRLGLGAALGATLALVVSSLCLARAGIRLRQSGGAGRGHAAERWIVAALVLGAGFVTLQLLEWRALFAGGIAPRVNLFWSSYFVLTGVHLAHVLGGLVGLGSAWAWCARGRNLARIGLVELYWHFVGFVWLILFVLLFSSRG